MATAKVGDTLVDCDPRLPNRTGTVIEVLPNGYAVAWNTGKNSLVLARRVHTKGIRSGYRLLRSVPLPAQPEAHKDKEPMT